MKFQKRAQDLNLEVAVDLQIEGSLHTRMNFYRFFRRS